MAALPKTPQASGHLRAETCCDTPAHETRHMVLQAHQVDQHHHFLVWLVTTACPVA